MEESTSASPVDLIVAIRDRLREKISDMTVSNCFVCDSPVPPVWPSGNQVVTICLGDAHLDEPLWDGGGLDQLSYHRPVLVTCLVRCFMDSVPKAESQLLNETRGLMALRAKVLSAILRNDECPGDWRSFWPKVGGRYFLRDGGFIPRSETSPRYVAGEAAQWLGITITCDTLIDEELPIL